MSVSREESAMAFMLTRQFQLPQVCNALRAPSRALTLFQMRTGVGMPITSQLR